jgi:hypothetical protein
MSSMPASVIRAEQKDLKPEHRPYKPFHGSMILLHPII